MTPAERRCRSVVAALLAALLAGPLAAAQVVLVNGDPAGTGFADGRPAVAAAGANGATTLGGQRLAVLQRAAEIWAAVLDSPVPIRVAIRMVALPCGAQGTTLARAGPVALASNFPNAPRANTAYHIAHANALARVDLDSRDDVVAEFNLAVDSGCSTGVSGWWYGLDPGQPVPADRIALLPVALHELAHGLGFSAQVDLATGQFPGSSPTLWSHYLFDLQRGRHWRALSAAERVQSARDDPWLVWSGRSVNQQGEGLLLGEPVLDLAGIRGGPAQVAGLALAQFGPAWPGLAGTARVVAVDDGVAGAGEPPGTVTDGCEFPFRNGARLAGQVALLDRGLCPFVDKVRHAQQHGAVGVIVANQVEGAPPTMGGAGADITIPAVGVTRQQGAALRRSLLRARLETAFARTTTPSATRQGCVRMYAPSVLQAGSSVSHFHSEAQPALLMAPSISRTLFDDLDLTLDLFRDLGWPLLLPAPPVQAVDCPLQPLP
ncbi:MAG: PA domain-containing protein [Pseudoxanthomonas sp.]|nr:PA domain-containing protein [Pseudoxanthomonas sp.]